MKELQPNGQWKKVATGVQKQKFVKDVCRYCGATNNLTKDHIVAKSRGGEKHIKNLQPLCSYCNGKKANYSEDEINFIFEDIIKRGIWYEWEHAFEKWLKWLRIVTKERNFDSKLNLWKSDF